ncbi:multidrug DMT transporter permease [Kushneria phosphatilytica]|nr:multidrug DMT transporter permease [Kushneria phosphatilytica]
MEKTAASRPPLWLTAGPGIFLLLWSLGFPVAKIATGYVDPMLLLALRFLCVLAVLLPLALWLRPPLPKRRADWGHLIVTGFLLQTLYFGLSWSSFAFHASAGTVALIVSLQPVLVALAAPAMVGEVISRRRWLGFMLGLVGAVIVIMGRSAVEATSIPGLLCAFGALLGITSATLYEKRFGVSHHPVTSNLIQYATGLITTLPLAVLFGQLDADFNGVVVASLAYLVIGNSLIAITLLLAMIRRGEASRVSALFYLVPPCAALLAWLMLGEAMPLLAWLGMAVAAVGVALVRPGQRG